MLNMNFYFIKCKHSRQLYLNKVHIFNDPFKQFIVLKKRKY